MLSGKTLLKNAEKALMLYPEIFQALEEFDKTHRLRKVSYKERANFTIDSDILKNYRDYCKKKGYSMSARIQEFIQKDLNI